MVQAHISWSSWKNQSLPKLSCSQPAPECMVRHEMTTVTSWERGTSLETSVPSHDSCCLWNQLDDPLYSVLSCSSCNICVTPFPADTLPRCLLNLLRLYEWAATKAISYGTCSARSQLSQRILDDMIIWIVTRMLLWSIRMSYVKQCMHLPSTALVLYMPVKQVHSEAKTLGWVNVFIILKLTFKYRFSYKLGVGCKRISIPSTFTELF